MSLIQNLESWNQHNSNLPGPLEVHISHRKFPKAEGIFNENINSCLSGFLFWNHTFFLRPLIGPCHHSSQVKDTSQLCKARKRHEDFMFEMDCSSNLDTWKHLHVRSITHSLHIIWCLHVFSAFLIIPRAFSLNGTPVPKPTHMVIYSYSSLQALAKEPNMIRAWKNLDDSPK